MHLNFKISRYLLFSIAISTLGLATNNIGFDFYHHAISTSSLSAIQLYNPPWIIFDMAIPRYLFFHIYLWLFSFNIISAALIIILAYSFIFYRIYHLIRRFKKPYIIAISLFLSYQLVFFSAVGFSISFLFLSFLSYFSSSISKKRSIIYLLIGMSLHPVGFLLGLTSGIILLKEKLTIIILSILVIASAIIVQLAVDQISYSQSTRVFDVGRISMLLIKAPEVMALISILAATSLMVKKRVAKKEMLLNHSTGLSTRSGQRISSFFTSCAILVTIALFKAVPSHFDSMGPAKLALLLDEPFLRDETVLVSIVTGAWLSPHFFDKRLIKNQYRFRK